QAKWVTSRTQRPVPPPRLVFRHTPAVQPAAGGNLAMVPGMRTVDLVVAQHRRSVPVGPTAARPPAGGVVCAFLVAAFFLVDFFLVDFFLVVAAFFLADFLAFFLRVAAAFWTLSDRSSFDRAAEAAPPFWPPFLAGPLSVSLPRPDPLFLPPPLMSFTVAQPRFLASFLPTPRSS